MKQNKKGFSLLELLVVILIIGVLAGIALPQYNRAVGKARFAALIPVVNGYKEAAESYYTVHGEYPVEATGNNPIGLDIIAPDCTHNDTSQGMTCKNGIVYDVVDYGVPNIAGMDTKHGLAYIYWLTFSDHPNQRRCIALATNKVANDVCKTLGGVQITGENYRYTKEKLGGNLTVYAI